jgi:hypothetical protein
LGGDCGLISDNDPVSRITDVIISADAQHAAMEPLTHYAENRAWWGRFALITGSDADRYWVQNGKAPASDIWVASFNHLDRPALLADLEKLPWTCPHTVQVLIREEEDDGFGLWTLIDGRLLEVPLPLMRRDPRTGILARTDCPGDDLISP